MSYKYTGNIRISDGWDVVVIGGGPGGCAAAAAAARSGAKTLLLEGTYSLGGMGTSGLVPAWCPFGDGEKIIYRGLAEKVFLRSKASSLHVASDSLNWVSINPEALKRIYDDLMNEYGVKVLFNTFVAGLEMSSDGVIDAVIAGNKAGFSAFKAKMYVDATGDGDIAAWAGADYRLGDDRDGSIQHATLCFILSHVSSYHYKHTPSIGSWNPDSPIHKILEDGKYPKIIDKHLCQNFIGPDTVGFNAGHEVNVDPTNPESTSKAMMDGRKTASALLEALKEYVPEMFANAFLVSTGSLLGIREGRRIEGDYTLTYKDFQARRDFDDEIGRNCYFIDVHGMEKENDVKLENAGRMNKGESHGIPFRTLLPKNISNLLLSGRCISADRLVYGSVRVMPVCLVTGEAAGTAAAMAGKLNKPNSRNIDISALRADLKKNDAYFK